MDQPITLELRGDAPVRLNPAAGRAILNLLLAEKRRQDERRAAEQ